ncbi:Snf2 family helicase/atpase and f-box protein [Globisporangium polare]
MSSAEEQDDEETIAMDEQMTSRAEVDEELALLEEEGELSMEELRARYAIALESGASDGGDNGENEEEKPASVYGATSSGDDDFEPSDEMVEDDETTIAAAEAADDFTSEEVDEEMKLLQEEGELSIDELRARYADALDDDEEEASSESDSLHAKNVEEDHEESGDDEDDEFQPTDDEPDDESTIAAAERNGPSRQEVDEELSLLQEEGELSIDELRARYADATDEEDDGDDDASEDSDNGDELSEFAECKAPTESANEQPASELAVAESQVDSLTAASERRSSLSTSGAPDATTITSTAGFKRPYLLTSRLSLREYQEAGVNWLVSMCEKRINGILADEMGLGKTIQTISLLAHLACQQGIWGPHLIVVPTSCLVNWEMEFKRWCPAFKVLTYFGSAKRRKELRQGWSKQNAFQVCITSYQLVVQDAHCFKRKKWYYLILDEAHNIKNWKSLRWQTLLTFNSQRRLLLTGTPLQNNIMELWSLMHFLMPHVFSSRREFTYWFQNPLALMVEGEQDVNNSLVAQLHGIIRPFVLRRLKKDVAKQMPGKFEHVVTCKLSKRQRFLYEDFISRSSTRRAMFGKGTGGGANFMSMMNVLMQLRKVCNHPDLFEPRAIESPFDMPAIRFQASSRCGFLMPNLVNEGRDLPYWSQSLNLPNLEIAGYEKLTSRRWCQLYYYDVSAPLPAETQVSEETRAKYADKKDVLRRLVQLAETRRAYWQQKRAQVASTSRLRVGLADEPMLGSDLVRACTLPVFISHAMDVHVKRQRMSSSSSTSSSTERARDWLTLSDAMSAMVRDPEERITDMTEIVTRAVCYVPKARARPVEMLYGGSGFASSSAVANQSFVLSRKLRLEALEEATVKPLAQRCLDVYYDAFKRTQLFFPDKRLVQFDCGKLQQLDVLLRELKRGNHRCLIFTQMSSMLNILEIFLNIHGHTYFRLDGSTKVEKRQSLMDRFNRDEKIFCFILSTRSGGLGINLTGADSVIFYDSDWNPAMDAQAQDRAHRIGQTRDVHIYRLVSEHTVEENILKKAQQKRHLDFLVMAEGQFTTDFFSKANLRELVTGDEALVPDQEESSRFEEEGGDDEEPEMSYEALEDAMAQIEDEEDVVAMKGAKEEFMSEQREFDEETNGNTSGNSARPRTGSGGGGDGDRRVSIGSATKPSTPSSMSVNSSVSGKDDDDDEEDLESVDGSVTTVNEVQGGGSEVIGAVEANEPGELQSDAEDDEAETQSSGDGSDDSMNDDDDDDDEAVQASRKRKRTTSRTNTTSSKKAKSQRQQHRGGDLSPSTTTSDAQQQRAKEKAREKQMELEEERKLQAWKDSVSSLKGFEDSLNPVDRYALHFREQIDPLYAYVPTAAAIENYFDSQHGKLDVEKIEEEKMVEELNLIADGELIAGTMEVDEVSEASEVIDQLHRALYKKERAHVHFERRRRLLTGVAWELKKCAITNQPFYYNVDTREAIWDRPAIWAKNEQLEHTMQLGFAGLMPSVLLTVMQCLAPYPDRHHVQLVCKAWRQAANHQSLYTKINANDLYTGGLSLSQLLASVAFGDTVVFGSGVYHVDETVEVRTPIKLLAAPDAHVELQMTTGAAQLRWMARGGMLRGFHLTRQSQTDAHELEADGDGLSTNWQHLLHVVNGGQVRVMYCDFDGSHQGNACVAVSGSTSSRAVLLHNRIYNGGSSGVLLLKGDLVMVLNSVYTNAHSGVSVLCGNALLRRNKIQRNGRFGIRLLYHAGNIIIEENIVSDHPCGSIDTENSGRRFVVRWNEMSKDEPDDLPHSHGKLRLKTFQIVEREIPRKSSSSEKKKLSLTPVPFSSSVMSRVVKTPVTTTSEQLVVQPDGLTGAAATSLPVAVDDVPMATPGGIMVGSAPTESFAAAVAAVSMPSQESSDESAMESNASEPGKTKPKGGPESDDGSLVVNQVPDAEMATSGSDATMANAVKLVATVGNGGATASANTKPAEPVSEANAKPSSAEPTSASVVETSAAAVALDPTIATSASTTAVVKLEPRAENQQAVKKKRKRRPKIEKLLVDGRVVVFHDTCEKRSDKVKKPRQFKNPRPEKTKASNEAMKGGDPNSFTTTTASSQMQPEQSENQAANSDSVLLKRDISAEEVQKAASGRTGDERAVLQPVTSALLSATRPSLATSDPPAEINAISVDALPVVVKKKRGRKPKIKPTPEAVPAGTPAAVPQ